MEKFKKYVISAVQTNPRLQPIVFAISPLIRNCHLRKRRKLVVEDDGKCLFIVGCGRSGNTLLRRLLMEQYDIYIPPETYVLASQILDFKDNRNKPWPAQVDITLAKLEYHPEFETFGIPSLNAFAAEAKKWPVNKRSFHDLIIDLYKWMATFHGRSVEWIGDKTPINTLSLGVIHMAFPSAKFIFMERDPVDVVASYLNSGIYSSPSDAAERWLKSYLAWKRFSNLKCPNDLIEIKYEELVSDSSKCIEDIGTKFDIPLNHDKKGRSNMENPSLGDVEMRRHHSNVLSPPSMSSIGKGRSSISGDALNSVRNVIGNQAVKRGYDAI